MSDPVTPKIPPVETQLYRFGEFALDLQAEELRRDGRQLPLAPKPFRVLRLLVTRAGRLVTREDLHRIVWGGAYVQLDESVNFCIREVRKALGDDVRTPRFIQTVPRRGYRFIARVDSPENAADVLTRARRPGRRRAVFGAGLLVVATGLAMAVPALQGAFGSASETALRQPRSVEARELYWRARYLLSRGDPRAVELLEQVISADTGFADAHVRLAGALLFRAGDSIARSLGGWAARRGVQLAPESATAQRALADWYLWREWDADRALWHYRRALELDSADAMTHHRFGLFWIVVRDRDRALDHLARARATDPLSTVMLADLGWAYAALREYGSAISTCRDVVDLEPTSVPGWGCLVTSYSQVAQWDSAAAAAIGLAHAEAAPDTLLHQLSAASPRGAVLRLAQWRYGRVVGKQPMTSAMLAAELGDAAAVEHWLRQAVERRDPQALAATTDPRFDPFRSTPWFPKVTRQLPTLGG